MSETNKNAALIEAAQNGHVQALETLIELYRDDIYQNALFLVKKEDDAEDITQNVSIMLYKNLQQLQNTNAFESWLRIITINECKMFFRKNSHATVQLEGIDEDEELLKTYNAEKTDENPQERTDRIENDRIIFELVKGLPEKYSRVLILYFYAELQYNEIAAALNISEGTVKSRLFTAKKKLRNDILAYEKKHDIVLHSGDVLGSVGRWLMRALSHTDGVAKSVSHITPGAVNTVSTKAATSVSMSVSNTVATRISIVTASVSIAVCVGITSNVFVPTSVDVPRTEHDPVASETAEPEGSSDDVTKVSDVSDSEPYDNSDTVSVEPSIVYVHDEADPSIIYRDRETVRDGETSIIYRDGEPSIIYRDRETIRDAEPSVVYRDREVVREAEPSVVYINSDSVRRYDRFADVSTDDGMEFRVYYESNEATLTSFRLHEGDIILPSYIEYDGRQILVTRLTYYFLKYDSIPDHSSAVTLQLPEKLGSIPNGAFEYMNIGRITGGENVFEIGENAFSDCEIKELDMREVFPNVIEIGNGAFSGCPVERLVFPDGIMLASSGAFDHKRMKEVILPDNLPGFVPCAETVRLIISDSTITNTHYNTWATPAVYTDSFVGIRKLYLELKDKNAVFDDTRDSEGYPLNGLYSTLYLTVCEDLYLPEGMKKLRKGEFEYSGTHTDEYKYPVTGTKYQIQDSDVKSWSGYIKNLYIPSTVTEIEADAFTTTNGLIKNIFLSKAGRSHSELSLLKDSVLKSSRFSISSENEEYICFTDPSAVFPEEVFDEIGGELIEVPEEIPGYDEYEEPEEIYEPEEYPEPEIIELPDE